jgi:hypothetical protein
MGYIGNEPTTGHFPVQTNLAGDGSTRTFTLTNTPASASAIEVSVAGVLQPTTVYSVVGTTLTLPISGTVIANTIPIFIRYLGETLSLPTPADGSVTDAKIAAGAVTDAKIVGMTATKLTGSVDIARLPAAVLNSNVPATDTSVLEYNIAMLAFKHASQNQITKFAMVDQMIDEYYDTTGIDAGASDKELVGGSGTAKYYGGGTTVTPTVTGGNTNNVDPNDSNYWIHKFTSNGNFITNAAMTVEWLIVAGGGAGGGPDYSGGGGAGGFRTSYGSGNISGANSAVETDSVLTASTYAVVVGDGGAYAASATNGTSAQEGGDSSIIGTGVNLVSLGGGWANYNIQGQPGGSGGGDGREGGVRSRTPAAGEPNQGMAGGVSDPSDGGAGGGGASAVGETAPTDNSRAGNGGAGMASSITGSPATYAGGGGGASHGGGHGTGGAGGGGAGTTTGTGHGQDGYGGGGGGTRAGGNTGTTGGDGVVIIRRPVSATALGADLILQSNAATNAPTGTAPTTGDLVVLIDDGGSGTTVEDVNVKGYISVNGSFSTLNTDHKQAEFTDEGSWGTAKQRILVSRNVDLSGLTTGSSPFQMKYRITTHSQSAGTMETRIHATSLAWA